MDFSRSRELERRLQHLVPGGSHTYAKGSDQYPELSPGVLARGQGCHVWDVDGNEFIEYGMGLRAVTLGHAYPDVVAAVRDALELGTNFTRPAETELLCAETFLKVVTGADMVKFTKDGSTADTAALKLARKYTGRELVALCSDHPFFSYDDWFICTTTMGGGIPEYERARTLSFNYNDLESARALFKAHPKQIAALFLEPSRGEDPKPDFLPGLKALCEEQGAVLVFDEMITGFRWHVGGAQALYGVVPHLSAFGKALANGFSVSALCGQREIMRLGSRERAQDDVFLLSTTHGAELHALAAATRTMQIYQNEPVVEHLHRQGERLRAGVEQAITRHNLGEYVKVVGRACNLAFATLGQEKNPSQEYRTLFLQELIRRGVLAPSFVVSYSHTNEDIDRTIEAADGALAVYATALMDGVEGHLVGSPSRVVFGRTW